MAESNLTRIIVGINMKSHPSVESFLHSTSRLHIKHITNVLGLLYQENSRSNTIILAALRDPHKLPFESTYRKKMNKSCTVHLKFKATVNPNPIGSSGTIARSNIKTI